MKAAMAGVSRGTEKAARRNQSLAECIAKEEKQEGL